MRLQTKQGRPVSGVEIKIVDEAGRDLPHDGCSIGEVTVRGPWVCGGYYEPEGASPRNAEGWFATGNVASIDADGYLQITDRQKDLIKCAGEWVSSVEIESLAGCRTRVSGVDGPA
ncbi:MAG: AMP-binding protein [Rhodospirillales bacterium]|nr:AMP-binding protein [Rhodospirillales bacterium]